MFSQVPQFLKFYCVRLLIVVLVCLHYSFAGKMESSIQEAIYLFELKGEIPEAVKILEKVANQGDPEDKEEAYFYLGKIQELSGNNTSSNFYYKQSLSRTNEVEKSYWLAERNAATTKQPEAFLQTPITLKNRIQKVFGTGPTFCLFQDETIGKIDDQKITYIPTGISTPVKYLHVSPRGFWYQPELTDSLYFRTFYSSAPRYSYNIPQITSYSFQDNHSLLQGNSQLTLITKKGIQEIVTEKYSGCNIEGYFKSTNEYILNCPDNALHLLRADNLSEARIIAQYDVIQKTLIHKNYLFLVSNGYLYAYIPKKGTSAIWKVPANNVETLIPFNQDIAILEASGKVTLFDQASGFVHSAVLSNATSIAPLAQGTIGLFNDEGTITAVDTLLHPLWNFNFTHPTEIPPIRVDDDIYLYFGDRKLQPILSKFYGKRLLQSDLLVAHAAELFEDEQWDSLSKTLDTLFKLEPGNPEGWFFKAIALEKQNGNERDKQRAWSEAVRLSVSNPRITGLILNQYGKSIGTKSISLLPISPKTRYPQLFGNKKGLFTLDPSADRLLCINSETGEVKWSRDIGKLENSPVVSSDDKSLVVASGYKVKIFDLNKETSSINIQLPGKAFEAKINDHATYITTWNGNLLKISRHDNKLVWSKKIYSLPFFIIKNQNILFTCNLEGEFNAVDESSGQIIEGYNKRLQGTISHMVQADSIIAIATTNSKLFIFNPYHKDRQPFQILTEASIASLQAVADDNETRLLLGLADQSLLLYSKEGAPLWKFKGKNSIFTTPFVKDGEAWIDQGNEIISISMKNGKTLRHFSTPGGSGSPFIMNKTLYSASPKRILYGFPL